MSTNISSNQPQRDYSRLRDALNNRVLVLDGSMGVMIQLQSLSESEFRGALLQNHTAELKGNNDILCLTAPEVVASIHRQYLEAGADIIETNTFNATVLSQREYGTEHLVEEINRAGAQLARAEADRYSTTDRPRFVAGSIGPTGFAASLSSDINDQGARSVDFAQMSDAFEQQAGALIDGGVDFLLIETIFDALNAKAAIAGARRAMAKRGADVPIALSITVSDTSGRILSGHTPEAFLAIVESARPLAVGFNCSAGPASLAPYVSRIASISPFATIFYPNAGLPDSTGSYAETPERFAGAIEPLLANGMLNIVGGCCGTTPAHIAALSQLVARRPAPRKPCEGKRSAWLAGIDVFHDDRGFINIGERCNVAGSRKFLRLIKEKNYDEAVAIARKQVEDGAMILDINMDDGMLDTPAEMEYFLRLLTADPVTASVPWMIDSSDFDTIARALQNVAGRAIVNSISLKPGEETFLQQARMIHSLGAAVVVMAFDERGQATTFERKIEICARAYRLLTEQVGFDPRDIIFDPNVLTIATGMPEHDLYALDFIRAVKWIRESLPGAKTSGGLSNLSFAFRGNNYMRQAMHAVFLYHAIAAGLTMAIMDPATKVTYDSIPAQLLTLLEDVVLCRRDDATDRLLRHAPEFTPDGSGIAETAATVNTQSASERLAAALVSGNDTSLESDLLEAVEMLGSANAVVEGPLMAGMERVGALFESGKMFLPQVVKSARTMHRAVEILRPQLEAGMEAGAGKGLFMLATVKGDVHDIGKNIAAVILRCNNFKVIDLGVQVDAHTIVEKAIEYKPDFIGLSGLISPSLNEMVNVAEALCAAGISVPLFVGGAATSDAHTALRIAPAYGDGVVVRVGDASQNPVIASRFLADFTREATRIRALQRKICLEHQAAESETYLSDTEQLSNHTPLWDETQITVPSFTGVKTVEVPVGEVREFINWISFNNCWKVRRGSEEAAELRRDADAMLDEMEAKGAKMLCRVGFFRAWPEGDGLNVEGVYIPTPRQKPSPTRGERIALCDFVAPRSYGDHVGCFVVSIGEKIRAMLDASTCEADSYRHLLLQSVSDRLAEAASEWLHYNARASLWGYAPDEPLDATAIRQGRYRGIRPAIGYPSLPDQMTMHSLAQLVNPSEIGVKVTENGALVPSSSVAGFYFASPMSRYFIL